MPAARTLLLLGLGGCGLFISEDFDSAHLAPTTHDAGAPNRLHHGEAGSEGAHGRILRVQSAFAGSRLQLVDVSGDGKADLVFHDTSNRFLLFQSVEAELLARTSIQHGGPFEPSRAQYADINGDARMDLVYQGDCSPELARQGAHNCFYLSAGDGTSLSVPTRWTAHGGEIATPSAKYADIDGDHRDELLFHGGCAPGKQASCVYASTFASPPPRALLTVPSDVPLGAIQFADVSGDGRDDLIYESACAEGNTCIWVSVGGDHGLRTPVSWSTAPTGARTVRYADVTGDNRDDAVLDVTCENDPEAHCLYVATSLGTRFDPPLLWGKYTTDVVRMHLAPLNGDTKFDLLLEARTRDAVTYVPWISSGSGFTSSLRPFLRTDTRFPQDAALGDVNGDGRHDLAYLTAEGCIAVVLATQDGFADAHCRVDVFSVP